MQNIRQRGAEVEYNVPDWYKPELEIKQKQTEADRKAKEEKFDLPIKTPYGKG